MSGRNGRFFLMAMLALGGLCGAGNAFAQVANTTSGASGGAVLLLGNNATSHGSAGAASIRPYTSYGASAASDGGDSGPSFAELMAKNGKDMADTGNRLANERAQRIAAQQAQLQQAQNGSPGQTATTYTAPVLVPYTPPSDNAPIPPRTFHID